MVTVWLNVDDLVHGVTADQYEVELGQLVHQLRQGGRATVMVATTPVLDHLPAYLACRAPTTGDACILGAGSVAPPPDAVDALTGAYNAAIGRVAQREGAIVVDLHGEGDVPVLHPDWVASDGFHPSFLGHAQVAMLFAAAYFAASRSGR